MSSMVLYVAKSPICIINSFRPGQICFDEAAITSVMLKFYFDKPKTVFKANKRLPLLPCASPFHSLAEMMGDSKNIWSHDNKIVRLQDTGGGSTY